MIGLGRWRGPGSHDLDPARAADLDPSSVTPIGPSAIAQLLAIAASIDAGEPAYALLPDGSPAQAAAASADLRWLADRAFIRAEFVADGRAPLAPVVVSGLTHAGARAIGRALDRNDALLPRTG